MIPLLSLESYSFWIVSVLFIVTYAGIAIGRIPGLLLDRTGIAFVGAIGLLGSGIIHIQQSTSYVDVSTLLLLFGLMILSANLRVAGFYDWIALNILKVAHKPLFLLTVLIFVSALLSSIFSNDIVCLAFTPVIASALLQSGRNPVPYLIALAMSSNTGSAATLIGNPQNMFIGQVSHLNFLNYFISMLPVTLIATLLIIVIIYLLWRSEFHTSLELTFKVSEILNMDSWQLKKSLMITVILVTGFVSGMQRDVLSLMAAALILISRTIEAKKLFDLVDWNLLLLFISLFVINGVAGEYKLPAYILKTLEGAGFHPQNPFIFTAVTALLSNLVSNVPAVLLLQHIPQSDSMWMILAMASTFAGNLTITGSIANLIVVEKAKAFNIHISFLDYAKAGFPHTILSLLLGVTFLQFFK